MAGRKIMPNSPFYNEVFLGKDEEGRFKPIPDEILSARPLYTGTAAVVGNKGKPLGTSVESQCEFEGSMKTVIVRPGKEEAALIDTMILSDHGFASDGKTPLLMLSNAKTGKPIRNDEEMGEADEVLLQLNGQTRRFKIKSRDGGLFEAVGDETTKSWVSDSATIGLLWRGFFGDYGRRGVVLFGQPSSRFGVVREAAEGNAPLVAGAAKLVAVTQPGQVVITGSDEQIQTALRVLRSQNLL